MVVFIRVGRLKDCLNEKNFGYHGVWMAFAANLKFELGVGFMRGAVNLKFGMLNFP